MQQDKIENFKQKLISLYSDRAEEVIANQSFEKPKTFRVNTLKADVEATLKSIIDEGFDILNSEIDGGYIAIEKGEKKLAETSAFEEQEIYIQELASMIPALILDPRPGEKIMDLCAAPGSKTSQIASKTENRAEIWAVEKGRDRYFKMREIVTKQGVKDVHFLLDDANYLPRKKPELLQYFDKVLVDAPCSNEGSIDISHPSTLKYWSEKEPKRISKLQKGLLNTGIKMLKRGGTIVYSTCTHSVEENEMVLEWALRHNPDVVLESFDFTITNFLDGKTSWGEREFDPSVKFAKRVLPTRYMNGFFVSKLRRK